MPGEKQEVEDERTETKTTPEMKQKTVEDVIAQKGELTNQQRQSPQKRRWRRLTNRQRQSPQKRRWRRLTNQQRQSPQKRRWRRLTNQQRQSPKKRRWRRRKTDQKEAEGDKNDNASTEATEASTETAAEKGSADEENGDDESPTKKVKTAERASEQKEGKSLSLANLYIV